MRYSTYTDEKGRRWRVQLPDHVGDEDADMGVPAGPLSLDPLDLPEHIAVALHNELHDRGIFTERDTRNRFNDVLAAVKAAAKLDASRVMALYRAEGESNHALNVSPRPDSAANGTDASIHLRGRRGPGS